MKFCTLLIELNLGTAAGHYVPRYTLIKPDSEAPQPLGDGAEIKLTTPAPTLGTKEMVTAYTEELSNKVFGADPGSAALLQAAAIAGTYLRGAA